MHNLLTIINLRRVIIDSSLVFLTHAKGDLAILKNNLKAINPNKSLPSYIFFVILETSN